MQRETVRLQHIHRPLSSGLPCTPSALPTSASGSADMQDIMGNLWRLENGALSVNAAGSSGATFKPQAVATPAPATALALDFAGFVWIVAGGGVYALNPRGPGYTDSGAASPDRRLRQRTNPLFF